MGYEISQHVINKKGRLLNLEKLISPAITITSGLGLGVIMHRANASINNFPYGQAVPVVFGNAINFALKDSIYAIRSGKPGGTKRNIRSDAKNVLIFNTSIAIGYGLSVAVDYIMQYGSK